MQSDVVTGIELVAPNAINKLRDLIGQTDPLEAKRQNPNSIRARFGADKLRNGIHGSSDGAVFSREKGNFFSK
jgi:nucleoside-diphosphate kinase